MIPPQTILDHRYEIVSVLGEGGFATVYRARHVVLLSDHAIKILHPHLAEDVELRTRFLAEGRIQARIKHANIVAVSDVVTSPHAGLVMDFVEGETLTEFLKKSGGRLDAVALRQIFLPIVEAVATAHAAGVVHRDLKPDNVLIAVGSAGSPVPRVTDFGIAKVVGSSVVGGAKQKTRTGMRMGTLNYMSPEQFRKPGEVDGRTDVFALGAILYELVTGQAAFASDSEFDTMTNIVNGNYEAPERLVSEIEPALRDCIRGALEPDVQKRTQDCTVLATQIRNGVPRATARIASNATAIPGNPGTARRPPSPMMQPEPKPPIIPQTVGTVPDAVGFGDLYDDYFNTDLEFPEPVRAAKASGVPSTKTPAPGRDDDERAFGLAPPSKRREVLATHLPKAAGETGREYKYCPKCTSDKGFRAGATWHCSTCGFESQASGATAGTQSTPTSPFIWSIVVILATIAFVLVCFGGG